jgi:hypothetical protein
MADHPIFALSNINMVTVDTFEDDARILSHIVCLELLRKKSSSENEQSC